MTAPDMRDTTDLYLCVACGKMGGVCRWIDDPVTCIRDQLAVANTGLRERDDRLAAIQDRLTVIRLRLASGSLRDFVSGTLALAEKRE